MIVPIIVLRRRKRAIVKGVTVNMFDVEVKLVKAGAAISHAYVKLIAGSNIWEGETDECGIARFSNVTVPLKGLLQVYADIAGAFIPELRVVEDWEEVFSAELRITEDWEEIYSAELRITEDWEETYSAELRIIEDWEA